MKKVNLAQKLSMFDEYWKPRIIGELNGQHVKIVKVKGEFVWHHHDAQDELFMVLKGDLIIQLCEGDVTLREGESCTQRRGAQADYQEH